MTQDEILNLGRQAKDLMSSDIWKFLCIKLRQNAIDDMVAAKPNSVELNEAKIRFDAIDALLNEIQNLISSKEMLERLNG